MLSKFPYYTKSIFVFLCEARNQSVKYLQLRKKVGTRILDFLIVFVCITYQIAYTFL